MMKSTFYGSISAWFNASYLCRHLLWVSFSLATSHPSKQEKHTWYRSNWKRMNRANSTFQKVNPRHTISYTIVRSLRSKFSEVELHFLPSNPTSWFVWNRYQCLNSKTVLHTHYETDPHKSHSHGLGIYIKDGFPCEKERKNEEPDIAYICFCVALIHSTTYVFTLYRPQDKGRYSSMEYLRKLIISSLNTSKIKLVLFHHRRLDPELPPVAMNMPCQGGTWPWKSLKFTPIFSGTYNHC